MSKEVSAKVISLVHHKVRSEEVRHINIQWFGGEPLLCKDTIRYISYKVLKCCKEYDVEYNAQLCTNGYALDTSFISELGQLQISNIHVTLDGPKVFHDRTRYLKGKLPTYDVIMNNIKGVASRWQEEITIFVRINLDRNNVNSFQSIVDELKQLPRTIRVYFRSISSRSGRGMCYSSHCLDLDEVEKYAQDFNHILFNEGLRGGKIPKPNFLSCGGDLLNSYAIDPDGSVYKCIQGLTTNDGTVKPIGTLTTKGTVAYDAAELIKWAAPDGLDNAVCMQCKLSPLCLSGCPLYRSSADSDNQKTQAYPCIELAKPGFLDAVIISYWKKYQSATSNLFGSGNSVVRPCQ